jgi:hypothetical protein
MMLFFRRKKVKQLIKIFLITVLTILLTQFFQGKTKDIDSTYEDAIESFSHYERVINDFVENPSEAKMANLSRYRVVFIRNCYSLIDHQTFYNKFFTIEPLLSEEELGHLKELKNKEQKLDKQYVSTVLNEVYNASDFSTLLKEAKADGKLYSGGIEIHHSEKKSFNISIKGTIKTNILMGYLIIESETENFFWELPANYTMTSNETETKFTIENVEYVFNGEVIF